MGNWRMILASYRNHILRLPTTRGQQWGEFCSSLHDQWWLIYYDSKKYVSCMFKAPRFRGFWTHTTHTHLQWASLDDPEITNITSDPANVALKSINRSCPVYQSCFHLWGATKPKGGFKFLTLHGFPTWWFLKKNGGSTKTWIWLQKWSSMTWMIWGTPVT